MNYERLDREVHKIVIRELEGLDDGVNPVEHLRQTELKGQFVSEGKTIKVQIANLSENLIRVAVQEFYTHYW